MKPRMNSFAVAPQLMQAMLDMENKVAHSGLDETIRHLVKIRASQINGCAYCIHMHTGEARAHGETEERIYLLDGWRESPLYTDRERAALGWTEALTLVAETRAPDADYEALKAQFSEEEIVKLTLVITTINAWNRISVGFRSIHPVKAVHAVA
ncbi:carboxymuconolactone decarboxylase family protein [Phyllobacterium leguminum]|uniref:AhpD family alkylhydroperoxidase n=1 Tax=Phyllobacterium leguminum TaxID=314237 RepID=A0A318T3G4_9HYPH|nr:carboxymuconolactone decarboxylase family protein [Phyllobacterium leguminum]PYE87400.1 AhpD family alkylhydroperoxidase [Phyllobacterium leguminum]